MAHLLLCRGALAIPEPWKELLKHGVRATDFEPCMLEE